MRTGFNRLVYGSPVIFPVDNVTPASLATWDGLNQELGPKPASILVFNPMDTSIVVAVTFSGDGITYGSPVNTTVTPKGFVDVSLLSATAGPWAKVAVTTAGGRAFFSFVNYEQGNGLA